MGTDEEILVVGPDLSSPQNIEPPPLFKENHPFKETSPQKDHSSSETTKPTKDSTENPLTTEVEIISQKTSSLHTSPLPPPTPLSFPPHLFPTPPHVSSLNKTTRCHLDKVREYL